MDIDVLAIQTEIKDAEQAKKDAAKEVRRLKKELVDQVLASVTTD